MQYSLIYAPYLCKFNFSFFFFEIIVMLACTYLMIIVLEAVPSCHVEELWVEKYKPQSLSDLSVHKKKVLF
jgi:Rad17 P-loop domain